MRPARLPILALCVVLLVGAEGDASGSLDSPAARIVVADRFTDECASPVAGFCVVGTHLEGPVGDWQIDAYLSISYVGIALNKSIVEGAPYAALLPDETVRIEFRDLFVPWPVGRAADDAIDAIPKTPASAYYDADLTPDGIQARYVSVNGTDPSAGPEVRNEFFGIDNEQGPGYDGVHAIYELRWTTTDNYTRIPRDLACIASEALCPIGNSTRDALQANTPNVILGLDAYSAQAATNASLLQPPAPPRAASEATGRPGASDSSEPPALARAPFAPPDSLPLAHPDAALPEHPSPPAAPSRETMEAASRAADATPGADPRVAIPLAAAATATALFAWIALALFRRLTREDVRSQATRARLLALARETPGIRLGDAARALDVRQAAVQYHARVLAKEQLLVQRRGLGVTRLYASEAPHPRDDAHARALALTGHPVARAVLALAARPAGARREEIAERVEAPARTRQWHVKRLLDAGLLVESRVGAEPVLRAVAPVDATAPVAGPEGGTARVA